MKKIKNSGILCNERSANLDKYLIYDYNGAYQILHNRKTRHFKLPNLTWFRISMDG